MSYSRQNQQLLQDAKRSLGMKPDFRQQEDFNERGSSSYKAEIHFIGQVVGGSLFEQGKEGLICEMQLEHGQNWKMFGSKIQSQSQTSYADPGDMVIWAHPFDLHFGSDSIFGWPRLKLHVWRLDNYGKIDNVANGVINLPNKAGYFQLQCPTWRPIGDWKQKAYQFFLSCPPKLNQGGAISQFSNQRMALQTQSSGSIHIQVEVLTKNYKELSISC